jgi:hypothetical protein
MRADRLPYAAILTLALAAPLLLVGGCGAGNKLIKRPFAARAGIESGPGSRLWGDTSSGPSGSRVGCIRGRKLAVLITVHNRTKRRVMLLGGGGPQPSSAVIERVAVQVRLASPPPKGDLAVIGLRSWNPRNSSPVSIPPARDAWVQSNFLMRDCSLLSLLEPLTVNRSTSLTYRLDGAEGEQVVSVAAARIIITRGPLHPRLPVNQVG